MTIRYSKIIFFMMALIVYCQTAPAQTGGNYAHPPKDAVASVRNGQPYHAGMTKDELYKIYPASSQKSYCKQGEEEWILFENILTEGNFKDIIIFYLKDGVVSGWKKKQLPKTPDETFQTIVERRKKFGGADLSQESGGQDVKKTRRPIYQPPVIRVYNK